MSDQSSSTGRLISTIHELRQLAPEVVLEHGIQRLWPGEPAGLEFGILPDRMGYSAFQVPLPIRVVAEKAAS